MSQKAQQKLMQKFEVEDRRKLERAVKDLSLSSDLRHLMSHLYGLCMMNVNPFTSNALTTAHNTGKLSVGQEFFGLISEIDSAFLPELLKEMTDEQRSRSEQFSSLAANFSRDD